MLKIADLQLKNPVICAPLAGISNSAYYSLCLQQGAGLVYDVILFLQIAFYLMAAVGYILSKMGRPSKLLNIPGYFIFMNVNVFRGMAYLRTHKASGTWEKARRG